MYPFKPPSLLFKTKIYHPNIDDEGNICLSMLKSEEWKPSTRMSTVFEALLGLLQNPNPDDPLSSQIAEVYKLKRRQFDKTAQEWVKLYAS